MELDKLIYEVKEQVSAISDDRYLDNRLVTFKISAARADLIRKMLARRPGYNTIGMEQEVQLDVQSVSRALIPGLTLDCKVLRSVEPIPKLIYEGSFTQYIKVRTADVLHNTIEVIDASRANFITFEFPVVYAFLDSGYYMYFLEPNNHQELKYAILTGVFEDPLEVDPELTDYPLKLNDWESIKPLIVNSILGTPPEDPLNNSEEDRANVKKT
jgi:hypothetical protein